MIEAQNGAGEMFGFERFESLLGSLPSNLNSETLVERVLEADRYHLNGLEAQDDITVLVIRSVEL